MNPHLQHSLSLPHFSTFASDESIAWWFDCIPLRSGPLPAAVSCSMRKIKTQSASPMALLFTISFTIQALQSGIKLLSQRWWIPIWWTTHYSHISARNMCKKIWCNMLRQCIYALHSSLARWLLNNYCLLTFVLSQWSALYWDMMDPWDFTFNLMAVDPNILAVADPSIQVVDLR